MSDKNEEVKAIPAEEVMSKTEVKDTVPTEQSKEVVAEKANPDVTETVTTTTTSNTEDNSDVFITEKDTFDIKVTYYKMGDELYVESVDDEFDSKKENIKNIDVTFKYPSQGDYESIIAQNAYKSPDKMTVIDVMQMELTRIVILIRKWSVKAELNRLVELDPKIVKAIVNKVREKIGLRGIM